MLPHELLARANSAQLSEMFVYFKLLEDDRVQDQAINDAERELTGFFGEAGTDA